MMSLNNSIVIAQCTEYSIKSFGGTEALVAALIRGLSPKYKLVLVSNDTRETIEHSEFASLIDTHIPWRPEGGWREAARKLALELCAHRVTLANFHFGGNFGWGNRMLNGCPLLDVHRPGVSCV